MKGKRKPRKRIQSPTSSPTPIDINIPPLHIGFPFTLHHKTENKLCYFSDEFHMKKYIERCKLKPDDYKVTKTKPKKTDE